MMYKVKGGKVWQTSPEYKYVGKTEAPDNPERKTCPELIQTVYIPSLGESIDNKCEELRKACESVITGGFESECMGDVRTFDSTRDDQDNIRDLYKAAQLLIAGQVLPAGAELKYKERGVDECYPFPAEAIVKLMIDFLLFRQATVDKKNSLRVRAKGCTSLEELNTIVW